MGKNRKIATPPIIKQKTKCIICGKPSNNGKFMCRRCAEEIRLDQDDWQYL